MKVKAFFTNMVIMEVSIHQQVFLINMDGMAVSIVMKVPLTIMHKILR